MARGWNLTIVAVYGFFAGLAAIVLGGSIVVLKLSARPLIPGIGFVLSGTAGVFAAPTLIYFRKNQMFRTLAAVVLVLTGLIWASTAYPTLFMHLKMFGKWAPLTMRH
jgi:putative membrane protein